MALQTSGQISLNNIASEFGGTQPHSISEYYNGAGLVPNKVYNASIPTSGQISFSNFYGASQIIVETRTASGLYSTSNTSKIVAKGTKSGQTHEARGYFPTSEISGTGVSISNSVFRGYSILGFGMTPLPRSSGQVGAEPTYDETLYFHLKSPSGAISRNIFQEINISGVGTFYSATSNEYGVTNDINWPGLTIDLTVSLSGLGFTYWHWFLTDAQRTNFINQALWTITLTY